MQIDDNKSQEMASKRTNDNSKSVQHKIRLANPICDSRTQEMMSDAVRNEHAVGGESVHRFEEEFARYVGVKHAVSTSSGTAALSLALLALGIKPGNEVLTSPATFIATANSAIHAGAVPRFADIEMCTYGIDPKAVVASCSVSTKAIIPVHLYGQPVDFDSLRTVAQERNLRVVEDACQAHGAVYRGKKAGSLGDAGCFSFYPTKNMTVLGDGGMVVTNDETLASAVAKLRDCGRKSRYLHDVIGFTYRLNTVNAAAGRAQLMRLDEWNETRRKNARLYHEFLQGLDDVVLPRVTEEDETPVFHQFVIRTSKRDELRDWLANEGIETGIHYPLPIHLQPIYRTLYGYRGGEYPNSELLCRTCLSLPVNPTLTPNDIEYVARETRVFLQKEP